MVEKPTPVDEVPPKAADPPKVVDPPKTDDQMLDDYEYPGLEYDRAQREMLKGMTEQERIEHFQKEIVDQQAAVDAWHVEKFGKPALPNH